MKRKIFISIFLLTIPAHILSGSQERIVKDALGYDFKMSSSPHRIVSIAPNITEILFALGLEEKIVGVTRYCDYPNESQEKEKIGGMIDLSLEKIKSLNPDLIIGFRGNPLSILKRMKKLRLPLFVLEMGTNIDSVYSIIKKIGDITYREKEAMALIQSLENRQAEIQMALRDIRKEPKVFFLLHGPGLWTGGKESIFDNLVREARGINIAGNVPRKWILYDREQLVYENPDIIIIVSKSNKEFIQTKNWIEKENYLQSIKAVKMQKIYFLNENLATRPGPRIIDALFALARSLHPSHF